MCKPQTASVSLCLRVLVIVFLIRCAFRCTGGFGATLIFFNKFTSSPPPMAIFEFYP